MSAPSTGEPQNIPISQIIHEWVAVVRDFQTAEARAEAICGETWLKARC
jgi:hypothetical protein